MSSLLNKIKRAHKHNPNASKIGGAILGALVLAKVAALAVKHVEYEHSIDISEDVLKRIQYVRREVRISKWVFILGAIGFVFAQLLSRALYYSGGIFQGFSLVIVILLLVALGAVLVYRNELKSLRRNNPHEWIAADALEVEAERAAEARRIANYTSL